MRYRSRGAERLAGSLITYGSVNLARRADRFETNDAVDITRDALNYIRDNPDRFRAALSVHVQLSLYALIAAVAIFVPLGVLASRSRTAGPAVIGIVSAARVVPSVAVLFLLFPYRREIGDVLPMFDRSFAMALIVLTLLAGPPLIINTDAGLRSVDAAILENARGLG